MSFGFDFGSDASAGMVLFQNQVNGAKTDLFSAWNALDPSGPSSQLQSAFDAYQSTFNGLFDQFNAVFNFDPFGDTFASMQSALQGQFTSMQNTIDAGGTVQDGIAFANASVMPAVDAAVVDTKNVAAGLAGELDGTVGRIIPYIEDIQPGDRWRVEELEVKGRAKASAIRIVIPSVIDDEPANTIALERAGIASRIKIGSRLRGIKEDTEQTTFCGSVVDIHHRLDGRTNVADPDALIVTGFSDHWLFENVRICGRWVLASDGPAYQQGWDAHFNPGGRANCIWYGGMPWFAPNADYGLIDGETPPAASAGSSSKACYWTLEAILLYLWNVYYEDGMAYGSATSSFPYLARVGKTYVKWASTYAAGIDSDSLSDFNTAFGQGNQTVGAGRLGRDMNVEGLSLLDALEMLLENAGGFMLSLCPLDSGQSDLRIVRSRARAGEGISLEYAHGGAAKDVLNRAIITGVELSEDGRNIVTSYTGTGQQVMVERRISTEESSGVYPLQRVISSERFEMFQRLAAGNDVVINGETISGKGGATESAWEQALAIIPEIACFRVSPDFDFQAGTCFSGYPRAKIPRPVLPLQLSRWDAAPEYSEGAFDATTVMPMGDYAGQGCRLYVEIEYETGKWTRAIEFNGMESLDNGILYIPGIFQYWFLQTNMAYKLGDPLIVDEKLQVIPLNIRLQVSFPADHRIFTTWTLPGSPVAGKTYSGNPDMDRISKKLDRRGYSAYGDLYRCWLRKDSYPRPESQSYGKAKDLPGTLSGGLVTDALASDHALLAQHTLRNIRDNSRVYKRGVLRYDGYHVTTLLPGMQIKELVGVGATSNRWRLDAIVEGYKLISRPDYVGTEIYLT